MFEEYTRDMSDQERAFLKECIEEVVRPSTLGTMKWIACWALGFSLCAILGLVIVLSGLQPVAKGLVGGLFLVLTVVCSYAAGILIAAYIREWRMYLGAKRNWLPAVWQVLASNRVSVKRVRASSVITIEPFEDEGAGYVFDVGNGRVMFLKGDQYFPVKDGMAWPSSEFEIVRSIDGVVWVGLFCYGEELSPARVIKEGAYREDVLWHDYEEVVEATMEDYVSRVTTAA